MSNITGITPDPRRPGRFAILVDGRTEATLSSEAIDRLSLRIGQEYERVRDAVASEAAAQKTYDRAVNMLAARSRSGAELRRLLVRKGEPAEHADAAIARLLAQGYLDDERFARQYARSKVLGAGLATRRIQQELRNKGVDHQLARSAVEEVLDGERIDTDAIIDGVAARKLRTLRGEALAVQRRRLYAHLARRGYAPDEITAAMARAFARRVEDEADLVR